MATAVAFGLGVATIITLLVVPCMIALQDSVTGFFKRMRARISSQTEVEYQTLQPLEERE